MYAQHVPDGSVVLQQSPWFWEHERYHGTMAHQQARASSLGHQQARAQQRASIEDVLQMHALLSPHPAHVHAKTALIPVEVAAAHACTSLQVDPRIIHKLDISRQEASGTSHRHTEMLECACIAVIKVRDMVCKVDRPWTACGGQKGYQSGDEEHLGHAWQGSMHGRGACMAGGHAWQGSMAGETKSTWGMHGRGGNPRQGCESKQRRS